MNPDSPKYYKGFRYQKDEDGDEFWYDENDVERKRILYYSNGNKASECYCNEEGEFHNEEGYAYQEWNRNGELKLQYYYLNGYLLTEQGCKERTITSSKFEKVGNCIYLYNDNTKKELIAIDKVTEPITNIKCNKNTYFSDMLKKNKSTKPPLGLKPRFIHDEERLNEIKEAIKRYYNADKELPIEWIEEHNELIKTINKYKLTKK